MVKLDADKLRAFSELDGALRSTVHVALGEAAIVRRAWMVDALERWHPLATDAAECRLVEIVDDKLHVMHQLWRCSRTFAAYSYSVHRTCHHTI